MVQLLSLALFCSGASALVFETIWFRLAGLTFGNSVWASSLVLAGFMAGLAAGNGLASRFGDRLRRPALAYAALEIVIAAAGLGLVYLFPILNETLALWFRPLATIPWVHNGARFVAAFALLLVPTAAMGTTLPILVQGLLRVEPAFGRALGLLYGMNTLGAVVGVVVGELVLIANLGIRGTGFAAAGANVMAAFLALIVARAARSTVATIGTAASTPSIGTGALTPRARQILAAAALGGASLLALEVIWFRFLMLFTAGTSRVFALILAIVLVGIATGGMLAAWVLGRRPLARLLPSLTFVAAVVVVATYARPALNRVYTRDLWDLAALVRRAAALMLPNCILSGVLFPTLGSALHSELGGGARTAGWLTLANTIGAALGSLSAGFVLLPLLGTERSIFAIAVLYVAIALMLSIGSEPAADRLKRVIEVGAGVAAAIALALFPFGAMEKNVFPLVAGYFTRDGSTIELTREGLLETIFWIRRDAPGGPLYHRLVTNGYAMSSTEVKARRYMELFVWLPAVLHPELKSALLISFGVGNTARALVETNSLERIDVVDISRDVLDTSAIVYSNADEHPLCDPRVHVHVEDGRYFLQTTEREFDLITGEPPPPKQAGIVNLYSREYFALARRRLRPGGLISYWVPMHDLDRGDFRGIVRAFCDAFPGCSLWMGSGSDWILLGFRDVPVSLPAESVRRLWHDPKRARELSRVGLESPEQLAALFIADEPVLRALTADTPPVIDDWPQRISPAARGIDPEPEYARLLDPEESRRRFLASELVQRLVDEPLREGALAHFAWRLIQHDAESPEFPVGPKRDHWGDLYQVLTASRLVALPQFQLGIDADLLALARTVSQQAEADPSVALTLAHGLLGERDYAAAAREYGRVLALDPRDEDAFEHRVFALAMSGEVEGARDELERRPLPRNDQGAPRFRAFFAATFGASASVPSR